MLRLSRTSQPYINWTPKKKTSPYHMSVPDECDVSVPDECDVSVPDECDVSSGSYPQCSPLLFWSSLRRLKNSCPVTRYPSPEEKKLRMGNALPW